MSSFYEALSQLSGKNIFFFYDPNVLDWTNPTAQPKIHIHSSELQLEVPLSTSETKLKELLGLIQFFISDPKTTLITWNIKNFFSYVLGKTKFEFKLDNQIFDLAILESYCGITLERPKTFAEAAGRVSTCAKRSDWKIIYKSYENVFRPLIQVLPEIETSGVSDRRKRQKLFSYYEIDGQANGRLKCSNSLKFSFNPHTMAIGERENLRPLSFDALYMCFDFKHMEASVLQWLSQDEYMGEILASGKDFYAGAWEAFTGAEATEKTRQVCKDFFLPVIYGRGADSLSSQFGWTSDNARLLIGRMNKTMPQAFNWIKKQQDSLVEGWAVDYFGRRRFFDASYKARNFVIQSPASLICLHKLILLFEAVKNYAKIGMHVHDGYSLFVNPINLRRVYEIAKGILESEHELYPGLKMKVDCQVGHTLDKLEQYH